MASKRSRRSMRPARPLFASKAIEQNHIVEKYRTIGAQQEADRLAKVPGAVSSDNVHQRKRAWWRMFGSPIGIPEATEEFQAIKTQMLDKNYQFRPDPAMGQNYVTPLYNLLNILVGVIVHFAPCFVEVTGSDVSQIAQCTGSVIRYLTGEVEPDPEDIDMKEKLKVEEYFVTRVLRAFYEYLNGQFKEYYELAYSPKEIHFEDFEHEAFRNFPAVIKAKMRRVFAKSPMTKPGTLPPTIVAPIADALGKGNYKHELKRKTEMHEPTTTTSNKKPRMDNPKQIQSGNQNQRKPNPIQTSMNLLDVTQMPQYNVPEPNAHTTQTLIPLVIPNLANLTGLSPVEFLALAEFCRIKVAQDKLYIQVRVNGERGPEVFAEFNRIKAAVKTFTTNLMYAMSITEYNRTENRQGTVPFVQMPTVSLATQPSGQSNRIEQNKIDPVKGQ